MHELMLLQLDSRAIFLYALATFEYSKLLILSMVPLLGVWQWTSLMGISQLRHRLYYLALMLCLFIYTMLNSDLCISILKLSFVWWGIAAILVYICPCGTTLRRGEALILGFIGYLIFFSSWFFLFAAVSLRFEVLLLPLFLSILGANFVAYIVDNKFGDHKLVPALSSTKSVEGFIAALVFATCVTILVFWFKSYDMHRMLKENEVLYVGVTMLPIIAIFFSIVGDLIVRILKRRVGINDSSQMFGGLLNMIVSFSAALPFYMLALFLIGLSNIE